MKLLKLKHIFIRKRLVPKWQTYLFGSLMFTVGIIFSLAVLSGHIHLPKVFAITSWTQTNWSGGVGSSTSNQYVSAVGVDTTTTEGQIILGTGTEELANTGFESSATGWEAGMLPTQVNGIKSWHKSDSIIGLADGDKVSTWADSSNNNNTLTQGASDIQPIYKTNIVNNRPVVRFDGANDYMTKTGLSGYTNAATSFIVQIIRGNQTAGSFELGVDSGVNTGMSLIPWAGTHYARVGGAGSGDITWSYSIPYTNLITQRYSGTETSNKAWENGTLKNTTTVGSAFGAPPIP